MRKVGDMIGIEEGFIVKAMTGTTFSMSSDVSFLSSKILYLLVLYI
jgi:hypothetical protein